MDLKVITSDGREFNFKNVEIEITKTRRRNFRPAL